MATMATTMAMAILTNTTTDYSSPAGDKAHTLLLPQIPALVHGLFPNSNGYKDGEWGISAKADKREVMLVSDEAMLQREESPQTCSAFYDLSWLFLSLPCSLTAVLTCKLEQI